MKMITINIFILLIIKIMMFIFIIPLIIFKNINLIQKQKITNSNTLMTSLSLNCLTRRIATKINN
jgi:hypothetical protein